MNKITKKVVWSLTLMTSVLALSGCVGTTNNYNFKSMTTIDKYNMDAFYNSMNKVNYSLMINFDYNKLTFNSQEEANEIETLKYRLWIQEITKEDFIAQSSMRIGQKNSLEILATKIVEIKKEELQ